METLETERLLLRPWKTNDETEAASVFRYAGDPEIGPRYGWPPHASVQGSMDDIRDILAVPNNWAITIKDGMAWGIGRDEPVGSIALKPVGHYITDLLASDTAIKARYGAYLGDDSAEVGYWLGRPFWGRGYMPEALSAVLTYAFDTLGERAVWGCHYKENAQSGRVMEKLGLHVVGESAHEYFPLIDEHHDHIFRIVTAGEWRR